MRILICEDSALLREGLVRVLEDAGHTVVAAVPDARDLVAVVDEAAPELCILDVRLPPTFTDEGIRAALALRGAHPALPVLVLSQYVEERYASDLITGQGAAARVPPEGPGRRRRATSSPRSSGSAQVPPSSTRRSWRSCSRAGPATSGWSGSRTASAPSSP